MVHTPARHGLDEYGIDSPERVHWNLTTPALYEEAVRRREGLIAQAGPIVFYTGRHTGRSPKDKFIVRNAESERDVWWGTTNQPLDPDAFDRLHRRMLGYLDGKEVFVQN